MSIQNSHQISDVKVMLARGIAGNGIASISKTGTTGDTDTYTITMDDGTLYTFTVTNGSSIASIEKTGTSGLVDTYTITLTNGETETFTVTNGTTTEAQRETVTSADGSVTTKLAFLIDGTPYSWNGMTYVDKTVTLGTSETSVTLSSSEFSSSSDIDLHTSIYGLNPSSMSVSSGTLTLVFDAQDSSTSVDIRAYVS